MLHIGHRSTRYVVQNDWQIGHRFCDGFEVLVQALLSWLVVIRHNLQLAIGANAFGKLGQLDGLSGGVGAATGHDGYAAFGLFNRHPNDFSMFFNIDSRRLAGGAHHANAIGAFGNVPIDQFSQAGVIN